MRKEHHLAPHFANSQALISNDYELIFFTKFYFFIIIDFCAIINSNREHKISMLHGNADRMDRLASYLFRLSNTGILNQ